MNYSPIESSEAQLPALPIQTDARVDPAQERPVTIVLKGTPEEKKLAEEMASQLPHERRYLTPAEHEARFGASREDLEKVQSFATAHGLDVVAVSSADRCVVVKGTLERLAKTFKVRFVRHSFPFGLFLSYRGPVHVPDHARDHIATVLGLDDLPVGDPHLYMKAPRTVPTVEPSAVARHYRFPEGTGKGQRIAVIVLGGGFHEEDIRKYFDSCHSRAAVRVVRGENRPADASTLVNLLEMSGMTVQGPRAGNPEGPTHEDRDTPGNAMWTIETTIDVELIGAFARDSKIEVSFSPNTERGKFHTLADTIRDNPDVISMSWGGWESRKSPATLGALNRLLRRAALQGITLVVSSGDDGQLQFPASSPYVLACGGTSLHDPETGGLITETAWGENVKLAAGRRLCSGGGVSDLFEEPAWQASADIFRKTGFKGRGVPDVAAKADLTCGYRTTVGQVEVSMGGTSSAAPLWAALVATMNEELGCRLGHLTPHLYAASALREAFNMVDSGHSGMYRACPDWDPCTGLGSPRGDKLLGWFQAQRSKGTA